MKQFQVPQFIMVEDTVIGPFTIKQFLFIGAGGMLVVFLRMSFRPFIFYPASFVVMALAAGLAFLKMNGQPLPTVIKNAVFFAFRPRLYIWKRGPPQAQKPSVGKKEETMVQRIPTIIESKISDLAWSLDVKTRRE